MVRKESTSSQFTPVDQYRKQIGKQDYKKTKREMKSNRAKSDLKKSSTPVKDAFTIIGAVAMLILLLYFGLFWYLNKDQS